MLLSFLFLFSFFSLELTTCSPTGWHGECPQGKTGGHLTVKYRKKNGDHVTTKHIYQS
jgi:hypothetical protein